MNAQIDVLTLDAFNSGLQRLSLPPVASETFGQIMECSPPEDLHVALNRAPNDPNARIYIERRLLEAGCTLSDGLSESAGQPASTTQGVNKTSPPFYSLTVYGQSAALCVREDTTRSRKQDIPGHPTVRFEAATVNPKKPRDYLWDTKIAVQLSRAELPMVAAVFYGAADECRFSGHGEGHTKGFEVKNQQGRVYVSIFDKGGAHGIPIMPGEAFYVAALLVRQLKAAQPWLDGMDVNTLLTRVCGRLLCGNKTGANK